ncbi:MAG: restriction endonuclease subunit S [Desulfobacteraceae bacterium]|nr:restriction endonuclease subunit S [Desulfobacteraceae bacterium]
MAIFLSEKQVQEGWQVVKFGEIARNISERVAPSETDLEVYVGLEHLDPQSLRISRRGVPSDVKGQKLRVRPGQIIFGKRRAYQKKLAVADFDGICSAHAMVLEAAPGKIIPELLPFFMQSDVFMDRAVAISEGSLSPTIKWKTLAIQEFPLPPIELQKEILELFKKIDLCIYYTHQLVSYALLTSKIVAENMIAKFSKSVETIDRYAEIIRGVTYSGEDEAEDGQYKILRANNISLETMRIDLSDVKKIKNSVKISDKKCLIQNDILMCMSSGSVHHLGKSCLIEKTLDSYFAGGFMSIIRAKDSSIAHYLSIIFNLAVFRKYIYGITAGTNIQNLKNGDMSSFKFKYVDRVFRDKIVNVYNLFNHIALQGLEKKEQLQRIKQHIWQQPFKEVSNVF